MECCKMLAALIVVCAHVGVPGKCGVLIGSHGRFVVPIFFCISGYFNLYAKPKQLQRRTVHIIKLTLMAFFLCILWGYSVENFPTELDARQFLIREPVAYLELLILHASPYPCTGHLWYLLSLIVCYLVLWGYTCYQEEGEISYRPLYSFGMTLFAIYFTLSVVLTLGWMRIPYATYRNGWFMGLPMFLLGMFLRENEGRIWKNFHLTAWKLALIVLLSLFMTDYQWKADFITEIPLGTLIQVPVLLLLMAKYPTVPIKGKWFTFLVSKFGTLSTAVYVVHLMVLDAYERYLLPEMTEIFGTKEDWVRPLTVIILSLMVAVIWERAEWLLKKLRRK